MVITALILMPFFGPQPLSNPVAVVILTSVVIISCLLLSFNRYITSFFKSKSREKKRVALICPRCQILVDKTSGICPKCGNKL
ncbi:MAG: hypothetical protein ACFFE5_04275 [Candidatus Thorarchaeota archaeon]